MDTIKEFFKTLDSHRAYYFEILRIYLGCALFAKGVQFIFQPDTMQSFLSQGHLLASAAMVAHYVIAAHLIGGFFMAIGLFTRISTLIQIPILMGAVFFVHSKEGLFTLSQNLEFSVLVLVLLVLIFLHGAGPLSMDHIFLKKTAGDT